MNVAAYRRSMGAGVAFVVLIVVGTLLGLSNMPNLSSDETAQTAAAKYQDFLSSSGHRTGLIIGAYLLIIAGIAFIWFTNGLRARLQAADPGDPIAGRFLSGLGAFGAAALAASGMASAVVAGAVSAGGEPVPTSGDAMRVVMDLSFPFVFVVFGLVSAAVVLTVSVSALRSGAFPGWVVHTGWLAALGSILAIVFVPMVLPLAWFLAVAIAGVISAGKPQAIASPVPAQTVGSAS